MSMGDMAARSGASRRRADLNDVAIVIPSPRSVAGAADCLARLPRTNGIPVVIDGAATFEAAADQPERILGELPVAMSFHATKAFSTGEGGCVASRETTVVGQIGQALNFGFSGSSDSATPSLNGKLSEYLAAVGFAELDERHMKERPRRAFSTCIGSASTGGPRGPPRLQA